MKVLIVEDETAAIRNLRSLLRTVEPMAEIVGITDSVYGTIEWLNSNNAPDIILMDIHLADGDAFLVFERIKVLSPVVFITAYDRYALEAFRVNSIDYLLKPIHPDDLKRAIDKFRRLSRIELDAYLTRTDRGLRQVSALRKFLIPVKDKILPLSLNDIAFCYTAVERVSAYTFDGRRYPLDKSLDILSGILPKEDFFRANRQFIIARNAITDMTVWYGNRLAVNLAVETPERIIISKTKVPVLKKWIAGTI
jgi:two-component system response regulator LytT